MFAVITGEVPCVCHAWWRKPTCRTGDPIEPLPPRPLCLTMPVPPEHSIECKVLFPIWAAPAMFIHLYGQYLEQPFSMEGENLDG